MYQYPYGNAQQLNLDWILNKIQELESGGGGEVDLEEVANALVSASYEIGHSYRRYDYVFYNNKLYRCINDTTGAWNPSDWTEVVLGDDISILTRLINAVDAAAVVDVKFDTTGTNGKLQQKYNNAYHDVVEVDYTPVQNSKRPLSSNAGYDLNGAINSVIEDVSEIGTEAYSSQTVTLSSGNFETVGSITLSAGYWIITAYINASESFDESFYCRLLKDGATLARENLDGRGGGGISLAALCDILTGTANISLYAYQGSGTNKTVTYRLYAIRLKGV